jgi:hypothetical protein
MINPTLADQVREALATFQSAHEAAEVAAAAYAHQKRLIGSNEAERKERKAETSADEYSGYVDHLPIVEHNYKAATAHLERVEKNLNVLRELLQHDTANINRAWSEIADRTAIKYSELQMQPPARIILNTYPAEPDF